MCVFPKTLSFRIHQHSIYFSTADSSHMFNPSKSRRNGYDEQAQSKCNRHGDVGGRMVTQQVFYNA